MVYHQIQVIPSHTYCVFSYSKNVGNTIKRYDHLPPSPPMTVGTASIFATPVSHAFAKSLMTNISYSYTSAQWRRSNYVPIMIEAISYIVWVRDEIRQWERVLWNHGLSCHVSGYELGECKHLPWNVHHVGIVHFSGESDKGSGFWGHEQKVLIIAG